MTIAADYNDTYSNYMNVSTNTDQKQKMTDNIRKEDLIEEEAKEYKEDINGKEWITYEILRPELTYKVYTIVINDQ